MKLRWKPDPETTRAALKKPVVQSLLFHLVVVLVLSGTFTFFPRKFEEEQAMAVELLPVADKAQSTINAPVAKQKEKPKEPKPEPPKPAPPPKAEKPKVEDTPPPVKEPEKPKEDKKPPEKKGDLPTKKPEKKPPPKKEKKTEVKTQEQFDNVLKNLVGEDSPIVDKTDAKNTDRAEPVLTAPAPLGSQMSMSEMDLLREQLAGCWNLLPGARDAENLQVDVHVTVAPDKTVQTAEIEDRGRYNSDTFFRAAADAALRAVRSPDCSPLKLPDGKYDEWKSFTVTFDPKEMF